MGGPARTDGPAGSRGRHGEARAEAYLLDAGLRVVERNYQCRAGEIDLIMTDPSDEPVEVLVFVEVRVRTPGNPVSGAESIDWFKRKKLVHAAGYFLTHHPDWSEHVCRFDVICIDGPDGTIEWFKEAFDANAE